jgi:hypothetical protein
MRSSRWPRRTRVSLCLAIAAVAVSLPAVARASAPANDDLAAAQVVRVGDHVTGTLVDATIQTGEPATSSPLIASTVWYRLDAGASERLRMDTCGSDRYAELAVYTGASVAALTDVAHSVSDCAAGARVYLDAIAATTYYVRISGYDWGTDVALNVARPQKPPNDDFANAQQLGLPANVSGSNVDATTEPGEAEPSPFGSGHSVWYRYTAATNDAVTLSVVDCAAAAGSLSQLAVYTGESLGSLNDVGELTPACGYRSQVVLFPTAGTTYRIAVRGSGQTSDAFTLRLALVPSAPDPGPPGPPGPPNPRCPFELAAAGSVTYAGTASGGGDVCVTVEPGFAGVSWFNVVNPPRDLCIPFAVEHYVPALAIVARRFEATTSSARVTGTFAGQGASGTFQAAIPPGGAGICSGRVVSWTATTTATPPPALADATPPVLHVRGAATQQPLHSGRLSVTVRCPAEACATSASATVAGVRLASKPRNLRANVVKTLTLRISPRARAAIRRALRSRRNVPVRVAVAAMDIGGNVTTAKRRITLRR